MRVTARLIGLPSFCLLSSLSLLPLHFCLLSLDMASPKLGFVLHKRITPNDPLLEWTSEGTVYAAPPISSICRTKDPADGSPSIQASGYPNVSRAGTVWLRTRRQIDALRLALRVKPVSVYGWQLLENPQHIQRIHDLASLCPFGTSHADGAGRHFKSRRGFLSRLEDHGVEGMSCVRPPEAGRTYGLLLR